MKHNNDILLFGDLLFGDNEDRFSSCLCLFSDIADMEVSDALMGLLVISTGSVGSGWNDQLDGVPSIHHCEA